MNATESAVCHSSQEKGCNTAWGTGTQGSIGWARRRRGKETMRASLHRGFHGKRTSELGEAGLGSGQGG